MAALDPQVRAVLDEKAALGLPPLEVLTPEEGRRQQRDTAPYWSEGAPAMAVEERTLPGPAGDIRVRLYDPGVPAPAPALIYIHGGGWVICDLDTHDNVCRRFAKAAGIRVASVDYRLAPEHRFPAGPDDCLAAAQWLLAHGAEWGLDPARLAIGGDSAGGNLSLVTLQGLRDAGGSQLRAGLLVYGALSTNLDGATHQAFGNGDYLLSTSDMAWFWHHYLASPQDARNPRANPLLGDLTNLPPLYLTAAEYDPLTDDTLRLADTLRAAGNPFTFKNWPGMIHACLGMSRRLDAMADHFAEMGAWLRLRLA